MKKLSLCVVMCVIISFLTACSTTQNLSAANRATLHTVYVEQNVPLPKEISYYGVGQNLGGALGGLVGGILASASAQSTGEQIREVLVSNHINISQMVASEFISQLRNTTHFSITNNPRQADAIFKLQISYLGLYEKAPLSSEVRPIMGISATLVNRNNEIIWKDQEQVNVFTSPAKAYNLKAFFANPMLLRTGYSATTAATIRKLVATINR